MCGSDYISRVGHSDFSLWIFLCCTVRSTGWSLNFGRLVRKSLLCMLSLLWNVIQRWKLWDIERQGMKNTFTDLAQQIEIIQSNSTLPPLIVLEENTNSLFHCRRYEAVTEKLVSRFFGPPDSSNHNSFPSTQSDTEYTPDFSSYPIFQTKSCFLWRFENIDSTILSLSIAWHNLAVYANKIMAIFRINPCTPSIHKI